MKDHFLGQKPIVDLQCTEREHANQHFAETSVSKVLQQRWQCGCEPQQSLGKHCNTLFILLNHVHQGAKVFSETTLT